MSRPRRRNSAGPFRGLAGLRGRLRPPSRRGSGTSRTQHRRASRFGWAPDGGRNPSPGGARVPGSLVGFEVDREGGDRVRGLRGFRPAFWRRAAVWRRSPLLRGRWLPRSRLGRLAVAALSMATLGSGLWGLVRSSALDVDHIEVEGVVQVGADAARAAAGVRSGDPLFGVDLAAARAGVEALPWVADARVRRAFPNRVEIRVSERVPAAVVARPAGGYALLDRSGRVLADTAERPAGLPELSGAGETPGPGAWQPGADPALDVVAALPASLRPLVAQATLAGDSVTLQLVGGPGAPGDLRREIRMGRPEQLEAKAAALAALLERLAGRAVLYIDVRVPSAPVVGPVPAPVTAPASTATTPVAPSSDPSLPAGREPRD